MRPARASWPPGRGTHPLLARAADPLLHLGEARLDVLAVGEGAALAAQQQLVEQLHVDKGQQLLKQLLHQEGRHVVLPQRGQQRVKHAQDGGPLRRQPAVGAARHAQRAAPAVRRARSAGLLARGCRCKRRCRGCSAGGAARCAASA